MRFRLFVTLLVLFCAATASAQTFNTDGQAIEMRKIVAVLAGPANIVGLEQVPASITFTGDFDYSDRRRAINYVLANSSDASWEAVDANGKIIIRRRGAASSTPAPVPAMTPSPQPRRNTAPTTPTQATKPTSPFRDGAIQPPPPGCPAVADTDPDARPDSPDPFKRGEYWRAVGYECLRRQEAGAQIDFGHQMQMARFRTSQMQQGYGSYYPGNYGPYAAPGSYYPGHYGADYYPWLKGCADGRPPAYLEFEYKGRRDEKHLWLISINGIGPGTVDQGDTWIQKLPVCSDAAVVVTVEKIGLPWKWERQYSLRAFTSTEVPVGEFLGIDKPRLVVR